MNKTQTTSMREFLGRGWTFPVDTDDGGGIKLAEADQDIEEAIQIILETAKGERVMRPDFGCDIHEYAFETVNATTLNMIETSVEEALIEWEPRIDLLDVNVSTERLAEGALLLNINYRIRQTNTEFNLVYPFYLNE